MRRIALIAMFGLAAGCGGAASTGPVGASPSARPSSLTLHPLIIVRRGSAFFPNFRRAGAGCRGTGQLSDLHKGGGVTVYDASGRRVVATGSITSSALFKRRCELTGTVRHVPVLGFYQVRMAQHNKIAFSRDELENGRKHMTVG